MTAAVLLILLAAAWLVALVFALGLCAAAGRPYPKDFS